MTDADGHADRAPHAERRIMAASSSSKVTVEYYDPNGLFPIVEPHLRSRLPLRNLHWKSPSRPLRSIDSLHVELVPGRDPTDDFLKSRPTSSGHDGSRMRAVSSASARPGSSDGRKRRHQIPGLSQTPYLKVFLLRCDDNDTYKVTARKLIREWIRENAPTTEGEKKSNQENHDAYEWMILHVVLPDTAAAAQPRFSGSTSATSGSLDKPSASRWRASTTLFEKIRHDFNVATKTAPDRVAQIRLEMKDIPPHLLPPGIGGDSNPYKESPQEIINSWSDSISKFKALILISFDLRVSQYEEDIKEKDAQRHLPGWNFNTFFMLKEGLARGFESVGLVEDALVGYDELSVGLDAIIREQAAEGSTSAQSFLEHTEDLKQQLINSKKAPQFDPFNSKPISSSRKDYRGMILSNNISVFDFQSYIFSRQVALLLRLGNAPASRSEFWNGSRPSSRPNSRPTSRHSVQVPATAIEGAKSADDLFLGSKADEDEENEDLTYLAELCRRAMGFLNVAAHMMRRDLGHSLEKEEEEYPANLIDNFISSWSYAVAQQVLNDTITSALPESSGGVKSTSRPGSSSNRLTPKNDLKVAVPDQNRTLHPKRSSSLLDRRTSVQELPQIRQGKVVFEHGKSNNTSGAKTGQGSGRTQKSGQLELAAHRAELYLIQRRILERIGKKLEWFLGWASVAAKHQDHTFTNVSLDDEPKATTNGEETNGEAPKAEKMAGVCEPSLREASSTFEDFRKLFENLSDLAVKHYFAANRSKSAESIMGDLAAIKFEDGDFSAAAQFFSHMAPLYAQNRWNLVEVTMLKMYAECLQKLNRRDEYARILLDLLAKSVGNRKSCRSLKLHKAGLSGGMPWLDDDQLDTTGILKQLIDFSLDMPYDVQAPMERYFADIAVEPYIHHYDDQDGFKLKLTFRHLLEDDIVVDKAKVRLAPMEQGESREIWLETDEKLEISQGTASAWLHTTVNTLGLYAIDKVVLEVKKIHFIHETIKKEHTLEPLGISMPGSSASHSKIPRKFRTLSYPRAEALDAKLSVSRSVHIDKMKSIELTVRPCANNPTRLEAHLKAASAGLRLRTGNAQVIEGEATIADRPSPGVLVLSEMEAHSIIKIRVPYELEVTLSELHIKLDILYSTEHGTHEFRSNCTINIELPLDVNVHDQFMEQMLLSTFKVTTSSHVPLDVLDIQLQGTAAFDVDPARLYGDRNPVRPGQPPAFVYRIFRKEGANLTNPEDSNLSLTIDYRCLDDYVYEKLEANFCAALSESSFVTLRRLLLPRFWEHLKATLTADDWNHASFRNQLRCGDFASHPVWPQTLELLPPAMRPDLTTFLSTWHESNSTIDVTPPPSRALSLASPLTRRIAITVAVPHLHILTTTQLVLHPPPRPSSSSAAAAKPPSHHRSKTNTTTKTTDLTQAFMPTPTPALTPPILALGVPVPATIRIKHTRKWAAASSLVAAAGIAHAAAPLPFVLDVDADPNTWLVAGPKRALFDAREGEVREWPITLVPLRAAAAVWCPSVSVRPAPPPVPPQKGGKPGALTQQQQQQQQQQQPDVELTHEVDSLSAAAAVRVVPDYGSVTVGVVCGRGGERDSSGGGSSTMAIRPGTANNSNINNINNMNRSSSTAGTPTIQRPGTATTTTRPGTAAGAGGHSRANTGSLSSAMMLAGEQQQHHHHHQQASLPVLPPPPPQPQRRETVLLDAVPRRDTGSGGGGGSGRAAAAGGMKKEGWTVEFRGGGVGVGSVGSVVGNVGAGAVGAGAFAGGGDEKREGDQQQTKEEEMDKEAEAGAEPASDAQATSDMPVAPALAAGPGPSENEDDVDVAAAVAGEERDVVDDDEEEKEDE
ncbi:TMEM1 family protein-like protein [Phyllosticta citriasiana]|uniref:TMEM1 family protein-like protein n=1 Tax=Phyllosticta citriasiana TaxID=595635 RepID=A0ABR1KJD9_9PEZI